MEKRDDGKTYLNAEELAALHAKYGKPGELAPGRPAFKKFQGVHKPSDEQMLRGGNNGRAEQKRLREEAAKE